MSQRQHMSENRDQERRQQILDAALKTFASYSYRRVSMDDIAKVVGISRPALYQQFKNKADIYRGVVQIVCDLSLSDMETALAGDENLIDRLRVGITVVVIEPHRMIENMPHGDEIMDIKHSMASDVLDNWHMRMSKNICDAFAAEPKVDKVIAAALGATVVNAVDGMKSRSLNADQMAEELESLLLVIGTAINH